jgi:choline monooxygenase
MATQLREVGIKPLFSAAAFKVVQRATAPIGKATTLPAEAYTSPEVYERELQTIFRRSWINVGKVEDVPHIGDYFTVNTAGEPLIIVRDDAGEIRAMLNACRHRGCEVAQGAGNVDRFRCSYHGWVYGVDGSLKITPFYKGVEGFEKKDHPLLPIRLEIWEGFIFINLDEEAEPLEPQLSHMSRLQLDKYAIGGTQATHTFTYDLNCNWKAYVENGMEEYHTPFTHAESLQPIMPMLGWKTYPDITDQPWSAMIGQFPELSMSPTGKALFPSTPAWDDIELEFKGMPIVHVYPNLILVVSAESMISLRVDPTGPETCRLVVQQNVPKETAAAYRAGDPATVEAVNSYAAGIPPFLNEDNETAEKQHRSLRSKLAREGYYCDHEKLAHRFTKWVVERAYLPRTSVGD